MENIYNLEGLKQYMEFQSQKPDLGVRIPGWYYFQMGDMTIGLSNDMHTPEEADNLFMMIWQEYYQTQNDSWALEFSDRQFVAGEQALQTHNRILLNEAMRKVQDAQHGEKTRVMARGDYDYI